jgi:hypothetical protein
MNREEHNPLTLCALGFLAFYIVVMCHEIVGHGAAFYFYGARHFVLTSTSMDSPDQLSSHTSGINASRIVAAAGSLSTILLALAFYPLLRRLSGNCKNPVFCLFVWLLVSLSLFHGFAYIAFSGMTGLGDWAEFIGSWPHPLFLRIVEVAVGLIACAMVVRYCARFFALFPENLTRLALIPYSAATLLFCLASVRLPHAVHYMLISVVPGSMIGQGILTVITPVARQVRVRPAQIETVPFSPITIGLACACFIATFLTAPGIHFTLP